MEILGIAIREKHRSRMEEVSECLVTVEEGLEGDFRGSAKQANRQVSMLSQDAWQKACHEVNATLPWTTRRANLFINGREFSKQDVGRIVQVGAVRLEVMLETNPCLRMDEAHPGLREALVPDWRGGICCRVLESGRIAVGDSFAIK